MGAGTRLPVRGAAGARRRVVAYRVEGGCGVALSSAALVGVRTARRRSLVLAVSRDNSDRSSSAGVTVMVCVDES